MKEGGTERDKGQVKKLKQIKNGKNLSHKFCSQLIGTSKEKLETQKQRWTDRQWDIKADKSPFIFCQPQV